MGEIAELMMEGYLCAECGVLIKDGEACGYPRYCPECGGKPFNNYASRMIPKKKQVACPTCGKRFKTKGGMLDHRRDVHGT